MTDHENALALNNPQSLPATLDGLERALDECLTDQERLRVRDHAKALEAAAAVLERQDIKAKASSLVNNAERLIVKANQTAQGKRNNKENQGSNFYFTEEEVSGLKNMRAAHTAIDDDLYEFIKVEALKRHEAVSRRTLINLGKAAKLGPDIAKAAVVEAFEEGIPIDRKARALAKAETRKRTFSSLKAGALPDGKFGLVYADPPWPIEKTGYDLNATISPQDHYPTMPVNDIKALEVGDLAADPSILYMWVTTQFLPTGFEVMKVWGFDYSTNMVWTKPPGGMGFRVRGEHEILLVGIKGKFPLPDPAEMPPSVYRTHRKAQRHSEKPAYYYDLFAKLYPGIAKVELFSRKARAGWTAWGNEVA